jgi:DNA-binding CsgD family transcriptional regulator
MAQRLRRETTMTLAWIAARLQMSAKTDLAHLLSWHGKQKTEIARSY